MIVRMHWKQQLLFAGPQSPSKASVKSGSFKRVAIEIQLGMNERCAVIGKAAALLPTVQLFEGCIERT